MHSHSWRGVCAWSAAAVCLLAGPGSLLGRAQTGGSPFTVVLDAAHGGAETGTLLSPQLTEKDLVLGLSVRLRSALAARGMRVVTTREGDTDPLPETRAAEANHARAGACLVLHATASGSGVHLYTSSLGQAAAPGGLAPWTAAGAPFATASLQLASELSTALASAGVPFTLGRVQLAPMDALRCPAVALEVAPLRTKAAPAGAGVSAGPAKIDDPAYAGRLVNAVAAALVEWRDEHAAVSDGGTGRVGETGGASEAGRSSGPAGSNGLGAAGAAGAQAGAGSASDRSAGVHPQARSGPKAAPVSRGLPVRPDGQAAAEELARGVR